ncbi:MAG TPA: DegT/DnrJ/EryC1/StrS family aminotransferase [Nitrospirales bacterium]
MHVPLLDLKAQFQPIRKEVMAAIEAVCDEQAFILGSRVADLEKSFQEYVGAAHGVGVASGTDAILLALMASGVGRGDEVVTVPYTFFATAGSISRLGAKPVFVDIHPDSFNMDPRQIEAAITKKTKAIMPVHLFGQCAAMEGILDIARAHQLPVIEDAAQAIGAERRGRKAGAMGYAGCFSFFPSKNLGGFGDGGMVTTNDPSVADQVRLLRVHGSRGKYLHEVVGMNSRLDALQAAVLKVKLNYLESWIKGRQRNAARYENLFTDAKLLDRITLPVVSKENRHVHNQYVIRAPDRDELRAFLKEKGIGTEIYYPTPLHLQPCYQDLGYQTGAFPHSEQAAKETLALPIYAELSEEQQSYVVASVKQFYSSR